MRHNRRADLGDPDPHLDAEVDRATLPRFDSLTTVLDLAAPDHRSGTFHLRGPPNK